MNGLTPMYDAVVRSAHEERIQKAAELQAIREARELNGNESGARGRLGRMMIRAGARLSAGLEREQPTAS